MGIVNEIKKFIVGETIPKKEEGMLHTPIINQGDETSKKLEGVESEEEVIEYTTPEEEIKEKEVIVSTEIQGKNKVNLKDLCDLLPDREIEVSSMENILPYLYQEIKKDGVKKWVPAELPEGEIFPISAEDLEMLLGPGKWHLKIRDRATGKFVFNKVIVFQQTETEQSEDFESNKEVAKEETEEIEEGDKNEIVSLVSRLSEKIEKLESQIKSTGGLTFEQQLLMQLLSTKKDGPNEKLLEAVTSLKTAEVQAITEKEKIKAQQITKIEELKHQLELAKLEIIKAGQSLPKELTGGDEQTQNTVDKIVSGVGKVMNGLTDFMEKLQSIIDATKEEEIEESQENILPSPDE